MQQSDRNARAQPCEDAHARGEERRLTGCDQRRRHGSAKRQAAVDREVREVEDAEGDEHAEDHEAVQQALFERVGEDGFH